MLGKSNVRHTEKRESNQPVGRERVSRITRTHLLSPILALLLAALQSCQPAPRSPPPPTLVQPILSSSPTPFQPLTAQEDPQDYWAQRFEDGRPDPNSPSPTPDAAKTIPAAVPSPTPEGSPFGPTSTAAAIPTPSAQPQATGPALPSATSTVPIPPSSTPPPASSTPVLTTRPSSTPTHTQRPATATATLIPPSQTVTNAASCTATGDLGFETTLIGLINQERIDQGLGGLATEGALTAAARSHSLDMACGDFLSHSGSDGSNPADRVTAQGYSFQAVGENIYAGGGPYNSPQSAFEAWMDSDAHRANMLSSNYSSIGIGYKHNQDSTYGSYVTAVFTNP